MKEGEPTVLSTPYTKLLPGMSRRQIKEITHDWIAFRTGGKRRTRAQSSRAHERGTPKDGRGQEEVWSVVYHGEDRGDRFHL